MHAVLKRQVHIMVVVKERALPLCATSSLSRVRLYRSDFQLYVGAMVDVVRKIKTKYDAW